MPKSKQYVDSSESDASGSDQPKQKKTKAVEQKKVVSKPGTSNKPNKSKGAAGDSEENKYEIGRMRYVSVSEFKGKKMVSIREYYHTDDGDVRPGKKGISLSVDQWEKLKSHIGDVDNDIKAD